MMSFLRKSEVVFLIFLFALNLYCAFALATSFIVDPLHLSLSAVMLMMLKDKVFDKKE